MQSTLSFRGSVAARPRVAHAATGARSVHVARAQPTRMMADKYEQEFCQDKVNIRKEGEGKGKMNKVTFLFADGEKTIDVPEDTYLLDAADAAGVELPATCRGGICGTCVGRVASGTVDQSDIADLSFVFEQEEIDNGMALLCMARATSDISVETQADWGMMLGIKEWQGATGLMSATPKEMPK